MTKACYPGSFDPFTNGHLNVIERLTNIFDEIYIVVSNNINKKYLFSALERQQMIKKCLNNNKIHIVIYDGLIVNFCLENNINVIIRGLRNIQDYENEYTLFEFNKDLAPQIETLVLFPDRNSKIVSSSAIKELINFGANIDKYIPEKIKQEVLNKFRE